MGATLSFLSRLLLSPPLPPSPPSLGQAIASPPGPGDPLPDELWLRVYLTLGPRDRDALRRSLPREVTRRLKLPLPHDRRLSALAYAFRHGLVDAVVPVSVFRFMSEHVGDPAVLAMALEHGVNLGATGEAEIKSACAVENLQASIRLDKVTDEDVALLTDADLADAKNTGDIMFWLTLAAPDTFDAVLRDARIARVFDDGAHLPNFLFHVINFSNERLLAHVAKLPTRFARAALEYVQRADNAARFANTSYKVALLLKHCDPSPDTRAAIMRAAVNAHFSADVIELMATKS